MKEGVIGRGDIASVLEARDGFLYFASGVSNSREERESEFQREKDLLLAQPRDKHIVYFGSLSIFYSDSRYAQHKKEMESLVKENFDNYTIFRLGNITWGDNPNTIINFFREQKRQGIPLVVQDTERYVCDREEFDHWIGMIPEWSCEMNVPGRRMKAIEIANEYA
jgi:hypothetical protein